LVIDGAAGGLLEDSRGMGFGEDVRFRIWAAAVEVWFHSPLLGVGLGQFIVSSVDLLGSAGGVLAHNNSLSILADGGLIGAAHRRAHPHRPTNGRTMELKTYLRVLRQHVGLIIAAAVLGALDGLGVGLLAPTTFTAQTQLFVSIANSGSAADLQQGSTFTQE